jgi:hypothetical protein
MTKSLNMICCSAIRCHLSAWRLGFGSVTDRDVSIAPLEHHQRLAHSLPVDAKIDEHVFADVGQEMIEQA